MRRFAGREAAHLGDFRRHLVGREQSAGAGLRGLANLDFDGVGLRDVLVVPSEVAARHLEDVAIAGSGALGLEHAAFAAADRGAQFACGARERLLGARGERPERHVRYEERQIELERSFRAATDGRRQRCRLVGQERAARELTGQQQNVGPARLERQLGAHRADRWGAATQGLQVAVVVDAGILRPRPPFEVALVVGRRQLGHLVGVDLDLATVDAYGVDGDALAGVKPGDAGVQVVVVAVQRANDVVALHGTVAELSAPMRAAVATTCGRSACVQRTRARSRSLTRTVTGRSGGRSVTSSTVTQFVIRAPPHACVARTIRRERPFGRSDDHTRGQCYADASTFQRSPAEVPRCCDRRRPHPRHGGDVAR